LENVGCDTLFAERKEKDEKKVNRLAVLWIYVRTYITWWAGFIGLFNKNILSIWILKKYFQNEIGQASFRFFFSVC
jgi:hypothetical protein